MEDTELIFCKRCGAVTSKGICIVCGYDNDEPVDNPELDENVAKAQDESAISNESETQNEIKKEPAKEPKKRKMGAGAKAAIIVGCVAAVVVIVMIVGAVGLIGYTSVILRNSPATPGASPSPSPSAAPSGYQIGGVARFDEDSIDKCTPEWVEDNTDSMITQEGSGYDYFANGHGSSAFNYGHNLIGRDEIQQNEYFDPFYDSFDDTFGYTVTRHYSQVSGTLNGNEYDGRFGYYSIEGQNIPNIDTINTYLENRIYYDYYKNIEDDKDFGCVATIEEDSYITYNDDKVMSIVYTMNLRVQDNTTDYEDHYIYGVNIDLVNGKIMDNSKIIKIDDDFVTEFRDINEAENGTGVVGVEQASDDEIKGILKSDALIIFFTPLGLEVGYSYNTDLNGNEYISWGWVTVTVKDYENWFDYDFGGKTTWDGPVPYTGSSGNQADVSEDIEEYEEEKDNAPTR